MTTQKEIKRLRRSVKSRRIYAQRLRESAAEIALVKTEEEQAFARRLNDLADAELHAARHEEKAANEADHANSLPRFRSEAERLSHEEAMIRHEATMKALEGRLSIDRVKYMLAHHDLDTNVYIGDGMDKIEVRLGITHGENRPQMGARIVAAEIQTFGAARF